MGSDIKHQYQKDREGRLRTRTRTHSMGLGHHVEELREAFVKGRTRDLAWRKRQLEQVQIMIEENYERMAEAVQKDLGGPKLRAALDFLGVFEHASIALKNLDSWAADQKVPHNEVLGSSALRSVPKGLVLIIGPFNYPIDLILSPMVAAIAAGNCVVLKPSELTPHCADLVEVLVKEYLDTSCIRVVQGAVPETTELLNLKWDHIFYTGNGTVGRIVLEKAARHLTPVTLELGGKTPVIIDETAKMDVVTSRIAFGKFLNAGQTCVACDYVLIHPSRKQEFVEELASTLEECYTRDASTSPDYGRIVSSRHVGRLKSLLDGTSAKLIQPCGSVWSEEEKIAPPTLVDNPNMQDSIMKEEVFGPLLVVKPYESLQGAVETIRAVCPEPLSLCVFSESRENIDFVIENTESGGVCVNTCVEHVTNKKLPFGGKGASGMGRYYGKSGFDELSNRRSIFRKPTVLDRGPVVPLPPYEKSGEFLYKLAVRIGVLGIVPRRYRGRAKALLWGLVALSAAYVIARSRSLKS